MDTKYIFISVAASKTRSLCSFSCTRNYQ